jgi:hypothetical protein
VFVGATEVGGVAVDEITTWDTSSADAAAVDVAVGTVSNAENLTFIQLMLYAVRITNYILLNSYVTSE